MQSGQAHSQQIEIRLALQIDDGLLSGRATDGAGATKSFAGWLGLVDAIDALVEGEARTPPMTNGTPAKEKA